MRCRAALCALALAGPLACKSSVSGNDGGPASDGGPADAAVCSPGAGAITGKLVRMVYLIPSDRSVDPRHVVSMEQSIRDVQLWLRSKMPSRTSFRVHEPPVEVYQTEHPASYYNTNPNPPMDGDPNYYYWYNAVDDLFLSTDAQFDDPDNIWMFYLLADAACEQVTGGIAGVGLFPESDLRGLVQDPPMQNCPGTGPDTEPRCRWVGGYALVLFQALGVPTPAGPDELLTQQGYKSYPAAELAAEQIDFLATSQFVRAAGLPDCQLDCTTVPEP
jgi:hypothetical protein